jgi:hypothetical protein
VHALENVLAAVVAGGVVLDLQTVRPAPRVEVAGAIVCEVDAAIFFARADANEAALAAAVASGRLVLQAEERPDMLERYPTAASLMADVSSGSRRLAPETRGLLEAIAGPCDVREHCLVRRFRTA